MIPDEAVEAAAKVLFDASPISRGHQPWGDAMGERIRQQFIADARIALEAAAPFIAAQAWDEGEQAGYINHANEQWSGASPMNNPYGSGT